MEIGRLAPAEWPWLLARSAETAWRHVAPALRPATTPAQVAARVQGLLVHLLSQPGSIALVAREDGRPVGYMVVAILPDELTGLPIALFYDIYVEPEHRGKGVSRRLTAAGEAHCRALGIRVIRRTVASWNAPSLRLTMSEGNQPEQIGFIKVI